MAWELCKRKLPIVEGKYIVTGRMKYEFEEKYEYFVDAAVFHRFYEANPTSPENWETFTDWYEGQDEYEILAWQKFPDPFILESRIKIRK